MRHDWVIILLVIVLLGSFVVQTLIVLWLMRQDRYLVGPPGPPGPQGRCLHEEDQ